MKKWGGFLVFVIVKLSKYFKPKSPWRYARRGFTGNIKAGGD